MHGYAVVVITAATIVQVSGHGALYDPPSRSSMWRFNFDTPINYDDDQLYCGSFGTQWDINHGKCGVCGDPYNSPTPRPNEDGGTYGTGEIGRTYQSGQIIPVTVHMTATHMGDFTFQICNLDTSPETEECYQPLNFADGSDKFTDITTNKDYKFQLRLPKGLKCKQCSLRWHYHTGNSYGDCGDGTSGMGCGPQETFRSCSDVSIL